MFLELRDCEIIHKFWVVRRYRSFINWEIFRISVFFDRVLPAFSFRYIQFLAIHWNWSEIGSFGAIDSKIRDGAVKK